jgi:hypothetical protein
MADDPAQSRNLLFSSAKKQIPRLDKLRVAKLMRRSGWQLSGLAELRRILACHMDFGLLGCCMDFVLLYVHIAAKRRQNSAQGVSRGLIVANEGSPVGA